MKKIGGYAFLYIGMTGAGKSTLVKHNIKNVHNDRLLVYDVQNEYFDDEELTDIDIFQDKVHNLRKGHAVFEEATVFFSNRGRDEKMIKILVDKRHHENILHLCFHSIADTPGNIYRLVNYVYLFQTNDSEDVVSKRYPKLLPAWKRVNLEPMKAKKLLLPNGKYSPFEIAELTKPAKLLEL